MITRSAMLTCGMLSVVLHLSGAAVMTAPDPVETAGTMPAAARLGNSFADIAAGSAASVPVPVSTLSAPVAASAHSPEVEILPPVETRPEAMVLAPRVTPLVVSPLPDTQLPAEPVTDPVAPVPAEPSPGASETGISASVVPPETSPRPKSRTQPRAAPPEPARTEGNSPPSGTATPEEATRAGLADGTTSGTSQDAAGQGRTATDAGNAAVSNYPGTVMRQINRTRKPKVGSRGTATVGFEIAENGSLARLVILSSSGNAAIDAAALDHMQRAAPFPAPVAGAQRRFQVVYESRR